MGLCVEGAAVAAEVWWGSRRGSFSVRKRADEWRQFSPLGPEGLMGSVGGVIADLEVGGGSQGAVVGGETAWNLSGLR